MLAQTNDDIYTSRIGEQRIVPLPDSSRMSPNTSTRVRVDFTAKRRTVKVEDGEVLFEVAKDAKRPFVVQVAGTEVVATSTEFLVGYDEAAKADEALAVTLVEGQVIVRGEAGRATPSLAEPVVMQPGQRVLVGRSARAQMAVQLDRRLIDEALAWRSGNVVFNGVTLPDAAAQMNRYSSVPILVEGEELSRMRVSGSFRAGDSAGFARASAEVFGPAVHTQGNQLVLASK
nr:FecR domain-containing protein [Pelomonas sp. P8]